MAIRTIAIVGAGAWGTALAQTAARAGRDVLLVARDGAVAAAIGQRHANPRHLPDLALDPAIRATTDPRAIAGADAVLLAVPAQTVRTVCRTLAAPRTLVICAKGFETATGARLSEVVADELSGTRCAVLSGPNFAAEVAQGLPPRRSAAPMRPWAAPLPRR
jgi:glycerol-3-phosphate dehydrogenase (NAD(P)+)